LGEPDWSRIWNAFHDQHKTEYGHSFPGTSIEVVTARVTGRGLMPHLPHTMRFDSSAGKRDALLESGETYFRINGRVQRIHTRFYDRASLAQGDRVAGPAVFFQKDSTTVIPPMWVADVDEFLNLVITRTTDDSKDTVPAASEDAVCR
jgi:N-methylhydantoinase A